MHPCTQALIRIMEMEMYIIDHLPQNNNIRAPVSSHCIALVIVFGDYADYDME